MGDELWTTEHPSPQEVGDLLRTVEFAMSHAVTAAVAFGTEATVKAMSRDLERLDEARRQVRAVLSKLPPALPLTPEQEAEAAYWIGRALDRIAGES